MPPETTEKQKSADEMLEDMLESIAPTRDDFINRRINHINFARIVFWLANKSRKGEDFFYARDLCEFTHLSFGRVHHILNEFVQVKILRKKHATDTLVEFWFIKEEGRAVVEKYLDRALKSLGFKFKFEKKE